jgi:glycosyltransferase involved in cell wall biosynthesis
MIAAGIELEIRPLAPAAQLDMERPDVLPLARRLVRDVEALARPDVVFVHTLPLDCIRVVGELPLYTRGILAGLVPDKGERAKLCAYTTWEGASDITPEIRAALQGFDHVFWPSAHGFQRAIGLPNRSVLPHAYNAFAFAPRRPIPRTRTSGPYRFYYVGAWNLRKNPAGLIRAFVSEFDAKEDVELVLQCAGEVSRTEFLVTLAMTGVPRDQAPLVGFQNRFASDAQIDALHSDGDCFVTATRGEAWNYPAFDALLHRRHVIAPLRMGHDDFLGGTSTAWIGGCSQPAMGDVLIADARPEQPDALNLQYMGAQGLNGRGLWREPDLKGLATHMREAYANRTSNLLVSYDPADLFSYEVVGKKLRQTLEAL